MLAVYPAIFWAGFFMGFHLLGALLKTSRLYEYTYILRFQKVRSIIIKIILVDEEVGWRIKASPTPCAMPPW